MDDALWAIGSMGKILTPDEFVTASWLRASEWGKWPVFISQPLIPVLLAVWQLWTIAIAILICSWLWCLVRYRFVSYPLIRYGAVWVLLKWVTIPIMALYFGLHQQWLPMTLGILTPVSAAVLGFFVPPTKIGIIQKMIWWKVGFDPATSEGYCNSKNMQREIMEKWKIKSREPKAP